MPMMFKQNGGTEGDIGCAMYTYANVALFSFVKICSILSNDVARNEFVIGKKLLSTGRTKPTSLLVFSSYSI